MPSVVIKNEWSGDIRSCKAGNNSDSYQDATAQMINYFRTMAGLPGDVILDPELSEKALYAAIIFKAQKALSHNPPRNWQCWSETGNTAAGKSNIFYGSSGPPAIEGYIQDPGNNNFPVGHRRWILHPAQQVMGSGSTDASNALWVFGGFKKERPEIPEGVAWPPSGFVPYQFGLPDGYRWSFSYNRADFNNATITVKYNGRSLRVRNEKVKNGYGDNTIVWLVNGLPQGRPKTDINTNVEIKNVLIDGKPRTFQYTVSFIDPGKASPGGELFSRPVNLNAGKDLISAAFKGNRAKGEVALDSGADINTTHDGWTPLMIASHFGHEDFVDLMLENKADLGIELDGTWTALRLAESKNHMSIVKKLKDAGAVNIKSRSLNKKLTIPELKMK
jgi:hypothetical protein